jgi:hypothetical protein
MIALVHPDSGSHDALPVCLGRENPNRLVSLWEMYQICAEQLVKTGRALQTMQTDFAALLAPQASLEGNRKDHFIGQLERLKENCADFGIDSTRDLAAWAVSEYATKAHSLGDARSTVEHITLVFQQELSRHLFAHIGLEKAKYMQSWEAFISNPSYGHEAANAFPSSRRDMLHAGCCFACGFDDACVFHLMRVLEKGLGAFAAVFSEPFKYDNWHNVIERLESKIRKIDSSFGPDWKTQQRFYSEVACGFMFLKDAWRNHVMHGRDEFDSERAKNIYNYVCAFMKQLAQGGLAELF